jgi:hypothetical protein
VPGEEAGDGGGGAGEGEGDGDGEGEGEGGGGGGGSGSGSGGARSESARSESEGAGAQAALSYVHLWSDGCAAQLKCRWQLEWLNNHGIPGVRVIHNYFQSCHGKGPSDSEGAAVKNHQRHQEIGNGIELNTTADLIADCKRNIQIDRFVRR